MNYFKIYDSIISKALSENRSKGVGVYYEKHHIKPKCLGGENRKVNLVLLTAKEHFVCHKLLVLIYPDNKSLWLAYHSMVYVMKENRKIKVSGRDFEYARILASKASSGKNNHNYGKKNSPETRLKISNALKGHKFSVGKVISEDTKRKISIANKGKLLGVKKSLQMRQRLSATNTGRIGPNKGKEVPKTCKKFQATDKSGNVHVFKSGREMNKIHGTSICQISACLKKRNKSTGPGWHKFEYL